LEEVKIIAESDYDKFVEITINAYPAEFQNASFEDIQNLKERFLKANKENLEIKSYGLYRESELLGVMRVFEFEMNYRSEIIKTWGIGMVAVDFIHKKEKVAKGLLMKYHNLLKENNVSVSILYPFRSDFYKQMGYGYGHPMSLYYFKPSSFPTNASKSNIGFLTKKHIPNMLKCYNFYAKSTHGMILRKEKFYERFFSSPKTKIVGFKSQEGIDGYLIFQFKKIKEDNFLLNDMIISEFVYTNPNALQGLSTFIHSQADQINRIQITTQDEFLHFIISDARNGTNNLFHTSQEIARVGRGLMYRIVDFNKFLLDVKNINFNNVNLDFKISLIDSFVTENGGDYFLSVKDGFIGLNNKQNYDVSIEIDISDFSSLIMGVTGFKDLERLGLVKISDNNYVTILENLFRTNNKPLCMTFF
jgi:predicted acetyltransferase